MSQLHLINNDQTERSFSLNGGELLVGREDYCDIRLDYPGISRKHLRLLTVMDDTFLEDLASKNGTYVNGRLARKCALNDGDIIQLGEVELRFEKLAEASAMELPEDPDATTVIQPGQFGPKSRAAREAGARVEGISPVAERVGRTQQALHEEKVNATEPVPRPGFWKRMFGWIGG